MSTADAVMQWLMEQVLPGHLADNSTMALVFLFGSVLCGTHKHYIVN